MTNSALVKGNHVIGLKVISITEGKEIDTVKDLIYDPEQHAVRALLIDPGGWFSDAKVILTKNVHNIGQDAVVIQSQDMIDKASEVTSKIANIAKDDQYLTKTKIITEDGTDLGHVTDILFDPHTGKVDVLEVSQGALKNIQSGTKKVRVTDILTIGEDATIVKTFMEEEFENQAQEQGLQGALNKTKTSVQSGAASAKEQTPGVLDQLKTTAQELTSKAQDKIQEIKEDPKTQEFVQNVQQKTDQVKETTKERVVQVQQKTQEMKDSPQTQDTMQTIHQHAEMAKGAIQEKTNQAQQKVSEVKQDQQTQQVMDAFKMQAEKAKVAFDEGVHKAQVQVENQATAYRAQQKKKQIKKKNLPHSQRDIRAHAGYPAPESGQYRPVGALGGKSEYTMTKGKTTPPNKQGNTQDFELIDKTKHKQK
jgi:uncharacterized protein YrrD